MKNGKHKTNSFNSWSKKQTYSLPFREGLGGRHPYSLPFREGPGVGFFPSPSAKRERLTSMKHTAWGGDDEGEGEQCARGG